VDRGAGLPAAATCRTRAVFIVQETYIPAAAAAECGGRECYEVAHIFNMKPLAALAGLVALAEGATLAERKVSYDGYQVVRVEVGDQAPRLNRLVADLGLSTWMGGAKDGGLADIVIPPDRVSEFHSRVADLDTTTMHEDLGASMAEERVFHNYAGSSPRRE